MSDVAMLPAGGAGRTGSCPPSPVRSEGAVDIAAVGTSAGTAVGGILRGAEGA
jgi:hypothetical protein